MVIEVNEALVQETKEDDINEDDTNEDEEEVLVKVEVEIKDDEQKEE